MDVATIGAGVVSLISAAAAICSVVVAAKANKVAREAQEKAQEANNIAAEANAISKETLEFQKRYAPPPWSAVMKDGIYDHWVQNTSGQDIEVSDVKGIGGRIYPQRCPATVEDGDVLRFRLTMDRGPVASFVKIDWNYADANPEDKPLTVRRSLL